MSYRHIDNLYKDQRIFLFVECWATEKIHGTSAHLAWKDGALHLFSGGVDALSFAALFDKKAVADKFRALGHDPITIYGEAYGGSCMRMSATYGKALKFVAFEVLIGESWLDVPNAADVAAKMGLEFVHYERIPTTLEAINAQRDADSVQAVRNGMGPGHMREGVVLRPIFESVVRGHRVVCKHKRDEFGETRTPREVDPEKLRVLEMADAIANEWVTPMRLAHVLDKLPEARGIESTGAVIKAMIEDVQREASGEIVDSKAAQRAIGAAAAKLYKQHIARVIA